MAARTFPKIVEVRAYIQKADLPGGEGHVRSSPSPPHRTHPTPLVEGHRRQPG